MNLIFNIFLLAVLVYSGWHLGRYYAHRNFDSIKVYPAGKRLEIEVKTKVILKEVKN